MKLARFSSIVPWLGRGRFAKYLYNLRLGQYIDLREDSLRTILCYGDSNTYGIVPGENTERYPKNIRWPGVLQEQLGADWHVIEEGLPGRTTVNDDPVDGAHLNGLRYLRPCIESHHPLDIIIIMLGTNDLKSCFSKNAAEIARGMSSLVREIRTDEFRKSRNSVDIILVSPPPVLTDLREWSSIFEGAYEKSCALAHEIRRIAAIEGTIFLDAGEHAHCSHVDGFHIDDSGANGIGKALAALISARFSVDDAQ